MTTTILKLRERGCRFVLWRELRLPLFFLEVWYVDFCNKSEYSIIMNIKVSRVFLISGKYLFIVLSFSLI